MLLHIFYGRLTRLGVFGHRYSAYGLVTPGVGSTARREAQLSYTFRIYKQHSFALRFVLLQSSGREGGVWYSNSDSSDILPRTSQLSEYAG